MFPKAEFREKTNRQPSPFLPKNFPSKPPLHSNKAHFLPKIPSRKINLSRNSSHESSQSIRNDNSFYIAKSNESNDISHVSTNSNSSIKLSARLSKNNGGNRENAKK